VRGNAILSEQGRGKKTSLCETGTGCCVVQVADTAGAVPVAAQSLIYEQLCQCVP
jgi:hypothetical protein